MSSYKYINLQRISTEKLEQELKETIKLWSSSSLKLNMEEFAKMKSIAIELKRRGIITKEVEQVLLKM